MALIAAQYNNVHIHTPEFNFGVENKTEEFLKWNPMGKVPVLVTPEGAVSESTAIARYVARMRNDTALLGATFYEQGQVDQWIDWCNAELLPAVTSMLSARVYPSPGARVNVKLPLAGTYLESDTRLSCPSLTTNTL